MSATLRTAVVVSIAVYAQVTGAAHGEPALARIDPTISKIETGGAWGNDERGGRYRAVVQTRCSAEHCRDRLFVQWIVDGPGAQVVAATRFVGEVGDLTHLKELRFVVGTGSTSLEVHHEGDDPEQRWVRCLLLGAVGRYRHIEGACPRGG